jgi:ubiquinone/menaquinone biosynthesis C-methylase UbiE
MKDLFSTQSSDYARFRPTYPAELFAWLAGQAPSRRTAVDVGTGSGQAAVELAACFERVLAIDPSQAQLAHATPHPRVEYRSGPAEATGLPDGVADLLVVAQALHWFEHERFFVEVRRVLAPGGVFAAWCYDLASITPEVDAVVHALAQVRLGPYWEPERRLVETGYRTLTIPFPELAPPPFDMHVDWTYDHLVGYLRTWSPRQRYLKEHGTDPLEAILPHLRAAWADAPSRRVSWPLAVRAFRP